VMVEASLLLDELPGRGAESGVVAIDVGEH
jgi:hypothetical protein